MVDLPNLNPSPFVCSGHQCYNNDHSGDDCSDSSDGSDSSDHEPLDGGAPVPGTFVLPSVDGSRSRCLSSRCVLLACRHVSLPALCYRLPLCLLAGGRVLLWL